MVSSPLSVAVVPSRAALQVLLLPGHVSTVLATSVTCPRSVVA
jgi:hypothetical protein